MDTTEEFEKTLARLSRRPSDVLARFILSLAFDGGPIEEHVQTFVCGEDVPAAAASIGARIRSLASHANSGSRAVYAAGEFVRRFGYILDAIDMLVLPDAPRAAFDLLVELIECDRIGIEICNDMDFELQTECDRAAGLVERAFEADPATALLDRLEALVEEDDYGVRAELASFVRRRRPHG